jgi:hypothetical protein
MAALSSRLRSVRIDAQRTGISFWCPGCDRAHMVTTGGPGAWSWDGNVDAPTISPSIKVEAPPSVCHSFVRQGQIEFLGDCTHPLAGQRVQLPDWPGQEEVQE